MLLKLTLIIAAVAACRLIWYVINGMWQCETIWDKVSVNPPEFQENMRTLLRTFRRVTEDKGIRWWIDFGTLLGAWRQQDVTPWDHDADISYLAEDRPLLEQCVGELAEHGIVLNMNRNALFYNGVKMVDVDPFTTYGSMRCRTDPAKRTRIYKYMDRFFEDYPEAWTRGPLWSIRFLDQWFPCPPHPERFLKRRYPTCRIHMRLIFPHRQRCWFDREFWRAAWKITRAWRKPELRREYPPAENYGRVRNDSTTVFSP